MQEETLKALQASISHWERNAAVKRIVDIKVGSDHCALCKLFLWQKSEDHHHCEGCPVALKTGQKFCEGSSYYEVIGKIADNDYEGMIEAASKEVAFLKGLLPQ